MATALYMLLQEIENDKGKLDLINPCYPNYAIRNLYIPNGFDFVLLVEDELAKALVDKVIRENNLAKRIANTPPITPPPTPSQSLSVPLSITSWKANTN